MGEEEVSFEPSLVRKGLDMLLFMHPHLDVLSVNWGHGFIRTETTALDSPWVVVDLGQPSETSVLDPLHGRAWAIRQFAIWKTTGAVHRMFEGAVEDDPFIEP